jgi:hypothetical protein
MSDPTSTREKNSDFVPKVLLQAKKEVTEQTSGKENSLDKDLEKGPWDKGHWSNRK